MLSVSHALAYLISDQIMIQIGPLLFAGVRIATDISVDERSEKYIIIN